MDNTIHAFIYNLKPSLKGLVKAQAKTLAVSFNEVVTAMMKLEENV